MDKLKTLTKLRRFVLVLIALALLAWGVSDLVIRLTTCNRVCTIGNPRAFGESRVALVLGCRASGNLYFAKRIRAASALFRCGFVDTLIVSGDNHIKEYDEPSDMKSALVKAGIPEDRIVCDYAGFRTLDSVVRAKKIFGLDSLVIVSQPDHVRRAVFLARAFGCDAFGCAAEDVHGSFTVRTTIREQFAKVAAVIDACIRRSPKFLGKRVQLPSALPSTHYSYGEWQDPLSQAELTALMENESRVARGKGAASKAALMPTHAVADLSHPQTFLRYQFGSTISLGDYPWSKYQCAYTVEGITRKYHPLKFLTSPYFSFDYATLECAPVSRRLYRIMLLARSIDGGARLEFGKSPEATLAEAQTILSDLERRLGIKLQDLRFFKQNWPYHPGHKMSQAWSGAIPDCYLCSEAEWKMARHAFAYSRTIVGDYSISLKVSQVYYDERTITLTITDLAEKANAEMEFEREFLKVHSRKKLRCYLPGDNDEYE